MAEIPEMTVTVTLDKDSADSLQRACSVWRDARHGAPAYGQHVLVHLPDRRMVLAMLVCGQDQYQDEHWLSCEGTPIPEPTHWRKLPAPPNAPAH